MFESHGRVFFGLIYPAYGEGLQWTVRGVFGITVLDCIINYHVSKVDYGLGCRLLFAIQ